MTDEQTPDPAVEPESSTDAVVAAIEAARQRLQARRKPATAEHEQLTIDDALQ